MLCMMTLILCVKKTKPTVPRHKVGWLIARLLSGQAAFVGFTITIGLLPLSLLMIVAQTNPFWTSVLAYLLIGEKIRPFEIGAMMLCFCGVVCMAIEQYKQSDEITSSGVSNVGGIALALVTAWLLGAQNTTGRILKDL